MNRTEVSAAEILGSGRGPAGRDGRRRSARLPGRSLTPVGPAAWMPADAGSPACQDAR
ncbi:hypothetical protein ACFPN7_17835 [Amycolatopsis halotolerans]|uniref:hypothetical protein n=1 Tax=Amycolatopsis halotolerans TaxID=330083 RepID=UPI00361D49FB